MSGVIVTAQLDLADGIGALHLRPGATGLRLLVRLRARVLGEVTLPVPPDGHVPAPDIASAIARRLDAALVHEAVVAWLSLPPERREGSWPELETIVRAGLDATLQEADAPASDAALPEITVAVCTRDRPDDLALCLEAIARLEYPHFEVVVVDNAPATDATRRLVAERFPSFRYVHEPRPGLDWARNRAVLEARGAIIAYTDDDVLVDPGWLLAYGRLFAAAPKLAAATGSVIPAELETRAQRLFEAYGGFLRGWRREWHRAPLLDAADRPFHHGAGRFGTGANMAFRRDVLIALGGFDPALDVGTPSDGGGDLEMYFRVLQEGHALAYAPDALVRHRHRREMTALERQIGQWGIGFSAYVERSRRHYPEERPAFRRMMRWWWAKYFARRLLRTLARRSGTPFGLVWREGTGILKGRAAYQRALEQAAAIAARWPQEPTLPAPSPHERRRLAWHAEPVVAVRTIELQQPLAPLEGVGDAQAVEGILRHEGTPVGRVTLAVEGDRVGVPQVRERVAEALVGALVSTGYLPAREVATRWLGSRVHGLPREAQPEVSVILSTADRPDDLHACLGALAEQDYDGSWEIVVVDNRPSSGLTPPVVAAFPGVRLVQEPRQGASYGRNTGILASRGEIVVMTDDDVIPPRDWLRRIVAPFARPDVGLVTGNVLPVELETGAQRQFERYGGLGKGFQRLEFDEYWFRRRGRPVPVWAMGATANCAVRRSALADPAVGLFDETLGAGTPTGGSEDAYLYYRLLRAGWRGVYDPAAWVWHRHRRDARSLERQIRAYSAGHVALHLMLLLRERDARALRRLLVELPLHDARSLWRWALRRAWFPLSHTLAEIGGHLAGPWALWRSQRRVRQLGRSEALGTPSQHDGVRPADIVVPARRETPLTSSAGPIERDDAAVDTRPPAAAGGEPAAGPAVATSGVETESSP